MSFLEVQDFSKAFGGIQALNTCSISVEQGSITGLIGPNGSGKTTLFNVITGYERADKGTIRFLGTFITNAQLRVVLLDEPAGGINPTMINHLADRIRRLNQRGVTFLVVEHNMEFVMRLCDTVIVLHRGETIASGTPTEVRNNAVVLEAYLGD